MPDKTTFPVTIAHLAGLLVEAIFFGLLLASFGFCLYALFTYRGRVKRSRDINWLMVATSSLSFTLGALNLALGFYQTLNAFVFYEGTGGPLAAFSNLGGWVTITTTVTVVLQILVGDAMLIYRCWVVWNKAILPVLLSCALWLAACSMAIWTIYLQSTLKAHLLITAKQLVPVGTAFWSSSISLNIITTGLLVYRIWKVEVNNKRLGITTGSGSATNLSQIMRYIIESGLLYTVMSIMTFACIQTRSNAIYPISAAEIMIVPIAFNLIIIRISRIRGTDDSASFIESSLSGPLQFAAPTESTLAAKSHEKRVMMGSVGVHSSEKDLS